MCDDAVAVGESTASFFDDQAHGRYVIDTKADRIHGNVERPLSDETVLPEVTEAP